MGKPAYRFIRKPVNTPTAADIESAARHFAHYAVKRHAPENISPEEAQLADIDTRFFNREINQIIQQADKTIDIKTLEELLSQLDQIKERMQDQTWVALVADIKFVSDKCSQATEKLQQKIDTLKKIKIL